MPPFRLDGPERSQTYSRKPQIIYTKNKYSEGTKIENWQQLLQSRPIDEDPYCQGKVNYFLSHYHRWGTSGDDSFRTTTRDMLEQVFIKGKTNPDKLMDNYYTYNDNAECLTESNHSQCPELCANDFLTTMQHSYRLPRPYVMQRLAFPKIPFMQNRKYHHDQPDVSPHKFYDEGFQFVTCQLNKHKGFRWKSYNPLTAEYTKVDQIPSK